MKRFYTLVSHEKGPEGYRVLLDGQAIKTKSGAPLYVQNKRIVDEIVREWAGQEEKIDPETMPFTQIVSTKIDQVALNRPAMSEAVLRYLDTDLICYQAERPEALVRIQEECWQPWRKWAEKRYGQKIGTTTGLKALKQPEALHEEIRINIEDLDDEFFTLLQIIVPLSGSLFLGLAMIEGKAGARDVFESCFVEEGYKDTLYMVDQYGCDPHTQRKRAAMLKDLQACETYRSYLL